MSSEKIGAEGGEDAIALEKNCCSEELDEQVGELSKLKLVRFRFMVVSRRASTSLKLRFS